MADTGNYNLLQIVLQATGPVEAWHHERNKALRSVQGTSEWLQSQVHGGFMQHICDVFKSFQQDSLHVIGFHFVTGERRQRGIKEEDLHRDDALAEYLGDLALSLVGRRLKRCLWLLTGWTC
eukprot:2946480-Lingulodinium_polyedra.AAC.1